MLNTQITKKIILIISYSSFGSIHSDAALALIEDDFTSSEVIGEQRFEANHIDSDDWTKRDNPDNDTLEPSWAITGGELTNTASTPSDDMGVFLMNSVSSTDTSLTQITVSFDYSVGEGSTLYFHSALYTGGTTTTGNLSRIAQTGGEYFATGGQDFNAQFSTAHNLQTGLTPDGSTANAVIAFVANSLTGNLSGTYTQTFDISGYTGIDSVADISHILAAFTLDTSATGNGAVSIDNFSIIAVPEPSAACLLGIGLTAGALRRRRSSST